MTAITFETKAWITQYNGVTPAELLTTEGARTLMVSPNDMTLQGWTFAGTAQVTVDIIDQNALVLNKVEALKAQAAEIRAEATLRVMEIECQIQNLLAITCTPVDEL